MFNCKNYGKVIDLSNVTLPPKQFENIWCTRPILINFKKVKFDGIDPSYWDKFIKESSRNLRELELKNCENLPDDILCKLLSAPYASLKSFKFTSKIQSRIQGFFKPNMSKLKTLYIRKMPLNLEQFDALIQLIGQNKNLANLNLESTYPTGGYALNLIFEFLKLRKIARLGLNNCSFFKSKGLGDIFIKHRFSLVELQLRKIPLTDRELNLISTLPNIKKLNLSDISTVSNEFLSILINSNTLIEWLNLSGCPITTSGVKVLTSLSLRKLFLAETKINSESLFEIQKIVTLETLDISHNFIENMVETISKLLSKMETLKKIVLFGYENLVFDVARSYKIKVVS